MVKYCDALTKKLSAFSALHTVSISIICLCIRLQEFPASTFWSQCSLACPHLLNSSFYHIKMPQEKKKEQQQTLSRYCVHYLEKCMFMHLCMCLYIWDIYIYISVCIWDLYMVKTDNYGRNASDSHVTSSLGVFLYVRFCFFGFF